MLEENGWAKNYSYYLDNRVSYEVAYTVEKNEFNEVFLFVIEDSRENFYEQLKNYVIS